MTVGDPIDNFKPVWSSVWCFAGPRAATPVHLNMCFERIMDEAGVGTKAGSIVFSLPVTDTAGMRLMEEIEE